MLGNYGNGTSDSNNKKNKKAKRYTVQKDKSFSPLCKYREGKEEDEVIEN